MKSEKDEKIPLLGSNPVSSSSTTDGVVETVEPVPAPAAEARTVGITYLLFSLPETRWRYGFALTAAVLNGSVFPLFSIVFGQMFNSFYTLGYEAITDGIFFFMILFNFFFFFFLKKN